MPMVAGTIPTHRPTGRRPVRGGTRHEGAARRLRPRRHLPRGALDGPLGRARLYFFELDDETVWGATARILRDLFSRLGAARAGPASDADDEAGADHCHARRRPRRRRAPAASRRGPCCRTRAWDRADAVAGCNSHPPAVTGCPCRDAARPARSGGRVVAAGPPRSGRPPGSTATENADTREQRPAAEQAQQHGTRADDCVLDREPRRPCPRRRFRSAVRGADRPPGARVEAFSEIVPSRITPDEIRRRQPSALILSGGPASVYVEGAPLLDPEIYALGIPTLGICYGAQLIAPAARRRRRPGCPRRVRAHDRSPRRAVAAASGRCPRVPRRVDEPRRRDQGGAGGLRGDGVDRRRCRSRSSRTTIAASTACSSTPRSCTRRSAWACCAASCTSGRGATDLDDVVDRRRAGGADPRAGRRGQGNLRPVGRRRLRRRGGARQPGDRPPADVRLRRHRPDAAERERRGHRDVPQEHGARADPRRRRRPVLRRGSTASPTRRTSARRSATSSSGSSRSTPAVSSKPSSSCRARCTPT